MFDKHTKKLIDWLNNGVSKEAGRPILQTIHKDGLCVTADGYRMHITKPINDLPEGNHRVIKNGSEYFVIKEDGVFPDYMYVADHMRKHDVTAKATLDPELLVKTLKGMTGITKFIFHGEGQAIEICGKVDGEDVYALIMPMHEHESLEWWIPTSEMHDV